MEQLVKPRKKQQINEQINNKKRRVRKQKNYIIVSVLYYNKLQKYLFDRNYSTLQKYININV